MKLKKDRPRRYILSKDSIEVFFQKLHSGSQYVILRWWENLPKVEAGEDIDILVSNESLEAIKEITTKYRLKRNLQKIDVYTAGGLPGTDFKKVPYYPEHLAYKMLDRAVLYKGLYKIPCEEDHFFSLAYHAVYHKGFRAGLKSRYTNNFEAADHDYQTYLSRLAAVVNYIGDYSLEDLDEFMKSKGWQPPLDTLEKLAVYNPWILDHFFSCLSTLEEKYIGLCAFVVRSQVDELGCYQDIKNIIERSGFEILLDYKLLPENVSKATSQIRGGNWNKGPYVQSGGKPAHLIVALDFFVETPPIRKDMKYYFLENFKIVKTKSRIRDWINKSLPREQRCNVLHSSDRPDQALHYAEIINDSLLPEIERKVDGLRSQFRLDQHQIIKKLSRNEKRAGVFEVEYQGGSAILKIYRPGALDYFKNELKMINLVGKTCSYSPMILESSTNYFVTQKYQEYSLPKVNLGEFEFKFCDITILKVLKNFTYRIHLSRLFFIDLHEDNLLLFNGGFKVIDYEFAGEYEQGIKVPYHQSYSLKGVPTNYKGLLPFTSKRYDRRNGLFTYEKTGLSLVNFCYGNTFTWLLERIVTLPIFFVLRWGQYLIRKFLMKFRE